jgi:hypothetical protein
MVDYVESVKRPFTDIGKLVLGIVISIIPIVNFMFSGYLLNVAKSAMKKDMELPKWENWGTLFVEGLLAFVIGIIYMLPVVVILGGLLLVGGLSVPGLITGGMLGMAGVMAGLGMYIVVLVIIALVLGFLSTVALLTYAETRDFSSAFAFRDIIKKAFTGTYIVGFIITMVIVGVIAFIIGLIPVIGPVIGQFLSTFIVGTIAYTALAQAYREAK